MNENKSIDLEDQKEEVVLSTSANNQQRKKEDFTTKDRFSPCHCTMSQIFLFILFRQQCLL